MLTITRNRLISLIGALGLAALAPLDAHAQDYAPTRFSVEVRGQGPDVILIPGLGSSRAVWTAQAEQLSATHRLHLVQVRGFAGEPSVSADRVLEPLVADLARYIEVNGLERPAVIGHSMGGLAGLLLARDHGDRIGRLMIVDALPFFSAMFNPQATSAAVEPQARMMRDQLIAMDPAAFAAQQQAGMTRLVRSPERRAEIAAWTVASDRATFARAMYEVMTTDARADVARIQTPLTVVYAYDAAMGPEAMVDGLYRGGYGAASNVRFTRIDGAFHFVMLDQAEAFAGAVSEFLR
jgi:pimeloyl-ACP methyl ester carboxylesterase